MDPMEQTYCVPSCSYPNLKQTWQSKSTRITYCVFGVLWLIVGALNLGGVNAFSQLGFEAGLVFLSVGIILLLVASSVKWVKVESPMVDKQLTVIGNYYDEAFKLLKSHPDHPPQR